MRPLVVEYIFRHPLLKWIMPIVKALPIPDFDTSVNQVKIWRAEQSMRAISKGLTQGEHFILYPSGRLKSSGKEVLGGASAVHNLIQDCPDANVVLIRTTGLWGSSFSRALEGRSPDIAKTIVRGFWTLLQNGIFFAPRRKVIIEIAPAPRDLLKARASRVECNQALEKWYNQYLLPNGERGEMEPLQLVRDSFWKQGLPTPFVFEKKNEVASHKAIAAPVKDAVIREIRRILDSSQLEVEGSMHLATDLGMDSLNLAELISFLSEKFEAGEVHPEQLETVEDVFECAQGLRVAKKGQEGPKQKTWAPEPRRPTPIFPTAETIPEAFLRAAERMGSFAACSDEVAGILTYREMKQKMLVLAQKFKEIPGERVAVLLPASVGAYLVVLALQLAGKVPVMLNWTLGPKYLEEMMRASQAERVLSSWRFLEKLSHVDLGSLVESLDLLEDVRASIPLGMKLKGLLQSFRSVRAIVAAHPPIDPDAPAVILFTSGTEAAPKGVPLSHTNILKNLQSGIQCIELRPTDVVYGILPPFHSFGFTVAGIVSLISGMKITFYPDPTDSFALAEGIERWKVTIFCSAPSFLKGVLAAAKPGQLASVRYFITGAEKTPQDLYEKVKKLGSILIEGYGITECSPMLTLNRPNLPPHGVGRPLAGVEICTVHPETGVLLSPGSEGEICVRGPNVFRGYLNSTRNPFLQIEGKSWYRTGDLGWLDPDGNLILSGRLKRFTKIGGEMISLGAVEEAIGAELGKKKKLEADRPTIAVCSDEAGKLFLYTIVPITQEEANQMLKTAGFSRLVKISAVTQIEEIPLTGTGKTDYRKLR